MNPVNPPDLECDVVVVGAGAAGTAGAIALARSLRSVVVVDAGEPRNAVSDHAHNVLGREGVRPLDLLAAGRAEAEDYGVRFLDDRAVVARRAGDRIELVLLGGATVRARRLLLASGLVDELPDVPGLREFWGSSVLHCPYCHGWEVRGQRIGVLGRGPNSLHQVLLFRQLSPHVTLFRHSMDELPAEDRAQFDALGVEVREGRVRGVSGTDGNLVVDLDGSPVGVQALVVAPRFRVRGDLFAQLGGELTPHPLGEFVATGPGGATDVPGVWAAGNVADLAAMVSVASGAGVLAGASINADLVAEDARCAVALPVA
ncbi:NAD(P)/FAD-dependent oxidoreductase [Kineococcus radiotolerans]|uniref:FAD-dependent pyridine nucleotide-disulphide oxidoreductase n=1 Tax=Kineococcus radiotolerans (strain ATCC BAA-149 / DSM 14245 / SRS30216) TaxID=266940 RepID=A6W5A8_KINRD|nr:NAD(P)/FAD-dependent oxidoreductase [Kineococcus radiotolerans]ABS01997.1 FAD-dependent pyridine nucleotide-disulphide oxidoreductase [Kineococcus radiotolerans SRS30216 = ATCC BAA-149]